MKKVATVSLLLAFVMLAAALTGCVVKRQSVTAETVEAFDYGDHLDSEGFFENVTAADYVKLPEYKGIQAPDTLGTADPEEVAEQIAIILESHAVPEELDRAAQDGDTLNIDYVGSVDGVEFEGGNTQGMGTEVTIGVTSYIDDFLEQLIGHKAGEKVKVEVTFPDVYENNPDLQGKDAIFDVTINAVYGDPIVPEALTDEMAQAYGFTKVAELEEYVENWVLMSQRVQFVQDLLMDVETTKALPQSALDYSACLTLMQYQYYASMGTYTLDEVIADFTEFANLTELLEGSAEYFETTTAYYLAMQAIAEKEGLKVTEEDIVAAGYDTYLESYDESYVKMVTLQDYVIPNFIVENAVLVPAEQLTTTTAATTTAAQSAE